MVQNVSADELARRFNMHPHEEGGAYLELEPRDAGERSAYGSIYYYLAQGQSAAFHQIDCDEFWAFSAGDTLELWIISPNGSLSVELLGLTDGSCPLIKIPAGCIFGARHVGAIADGTFLSCITVPKFNYQGWRLYSQEEIIRAFPQAASFWN